MIRAITLAFLLVPGLAPAQQVHKCVDAQGRVKYSQSRCNSEVPAPKPPAAPEPPVPERVEKVTPQERQRSADAVTVRQEPKPVATDGRPDITEMTRRHEAQQQAPPPPK